jgi:hypothetical protein
VPNSTIKKVSFTNNKETIKVKAVNSKAETKTTSKEIIRGKEDSKDNKEDNKEDNKDKVTEILKKENKLT